MSALPGRLLLAAGLLLTAGRAVSSEPNAAALPAGALLRLGSASATDSDRAILGMAPSADGKLLATAHADHRVRLWDRTAGKELRQFQGHRDRVQAVAFAPDGKTLLSGSMDGTVRLWEMATGKELQRLDGQRGGILSLAVGPDGQTVACATEAKTVLLWFLTPGKDLRPLEGHTAPVCAVAFAPDGRSLVSAGRDRSVRLWDLGTGKGEILYRHHGWINGLTFAADGQLLASGSRDQTVHLWDFSAGQERPPLGGEHLEVISVAFSPDGRTVAAAGRDTRLRLWERFTGKERRVFAGHLQPIETVLFASDGKSVTSASRDGTVLVWDVTGLGKEGRLEKVHQTAEGREALWNDLASVDAARAYRAGWLLTAQPAATVGLLKDRLQAPTGAQIAQLIADLDSKAYPVREKARAELTRLGKLVEPTLQRTLDSRPSLEVRRAIMTLLQKVEGQEMPPVVIRAVRGIEILERIGTPEARAILKRLANGAPDIPITQEAKTALERLARRPVGSP